MLVVSSVDDDWGLGGTWGLGTGFKQCSAAANHNLRPLLPPVCSPHVVSYTGYSSTATVACLPGTGPSGGVWARTFTGSHCVK